jgi:hypothetical protein
VAGSLDDLQRHGYRILAVEQLDMHPGFAFQHLLGIETPQTARIARTHTQSSSSMLWSAPNFMYI